MRLRCWRPWRVTSVYWRSCRLSLTANIRGTNPWHRQIAIHRPRHCLIAVTGWVAMNFIISYSTCRASQGGITGFSSNSPKPEATYCGTRKYGGKADHDNGSLAGGFYMAESQD